MENLQNYRFTTKTQKNVSSPSIHNFPVQSRLLIIKNYHLGFKKTSQAKSKTCYNLNHCFTRPKWM